MYKSVHESVFEGILSTALAAYIEEEMSLAPSDDELTVMYPASEKRLKEYRRRAKKQKPSKTPTAVVHLRRVAVIFLAVVSVCFGILMINDGVRAAVIESVVTWYEKYVEFDFFNSGNTAMFESKNSVDDFVVEYIPEGFEYDSTSEIPGVKEIFYFDENGEFIFVGLYESENHWTSLDSEYSEYEEVKINGHDAYLLYNEAESAGSIAFGDKLFSVCITGLIDKEELIKVAENIK